MQFPVKVQFKNLSILLHSGQAELLLFGFGSGHSYHKLLLILFHLKWKLVKND